jgi:hypothetical protein
MGGPVGMPRAGVVIPVPTDGLWHPGVRERSTLITPSPYPYGGSLYPGVVPRGNLISPSIYPGRPALPRRPGVVDANPISPTDPAAVAIPAGPERSKIVEVPPVGSVGAVGDASAPGRSAVPRPRNSLTIVGPGAGGSITTQQRRPPDAAAGRQAIPRSAISGARQAMPRSSSVVAGGAPVPRDTSPGAGNDWRSRDHRSHPRFSFRPGIYSYPRYYYPRYSYPYGYGAFGLGYFYYDPYQWYAPEQLYWLGPGYYGHGVAVEMGELRLRITPGEAQVYVDGVFVGVANDFTLPLRALKLEIGTYHVDLELPGYQTLSFDVRITPGRTVNYDGTLLLEP